MRLPQLADVAGPRLLLEPAEGIGRQAECVTVVHLLDDPEEAVREHGDVATTLAQRRQVQRDQVDAIEQVFAKLAARHLVGQHTVRGAHDPHVDRDALARAEHLEGAVLQDAEQLHLRREVEVTDLVEEDRAAVREREPSLAIGPARR